MKFTTLSSLIVLPLAIAASKSAAATVMENYSFSGLNLAVPDGNAAGAANIQNLSSAIQFIDFVTVSLSVSGSWNGDLYAYVTNESGFSVLLNRTGKTGVVPTGYGDDGFNVVFDDTAANGNIHLYQLTLAPVAGSPLTGTWQPDGRNVNPNSVLNTDPVTALLNNFNGTNASGTWTLYVADMVSGDAHVVNSWGLTITGSNIPEVSTSLILGAFALFGTFRRKR